ncbi:hypothetical protein FXO38_36648 [Capsicum annuum]|nr:hypothetical protein FXO37_36686 [Capsicum annuum]KAF3612730.1 hypothetical protein FXO38_36648 [Capsicum annuum]
MKILPKQPPLIFNLFFKNDESQTVGAKRGHELEEQNDSDKEFRLALKKDTTESMIQFSVDKRRHDKMTLGTSFSHTRPPTLGCEPHNAPDRG